MYQTVLLLLQEVVVNLTATKKMKLIVFKKIILDPITVMNFTETFSIEFFFKESISKI